jgi:cyclopropane fatty-acyl-phospholipid synthase-like methyltransferase
MADFYDSYGAYKGYVTPVVGPKQMARFDAEIWNPAACEASMSFLELGCGTGAFLDYLRQKGVDRFLGIDHDQSLAQVVPPGVRDHFRAADVHALLADPAQAGFDRVVLLDVLEHFTAAEARDLLAAISGRLNPGGRILLKVPNAACPWGLSYQFGDLTHRTAFTPLSLRQLAAASGLSLAALYPQRQGSRRRMITDALVHRFLSWALLNPPQFWSANLYAVMAL